MYVNIFIISKINNKIINSYIIFLFDENPLENPILRNHFDGTLLGKRS